MGGKWFDELQVGQTFDHAIRRTVTETDNVLFTALTHNPALLHLDEEYCRTQTEFGRRIVNSCFTLGLMVGISVGDTTLGTAVANLGWDEVRFPKPLFHGDTVRVETEVIELRESRSRPDQGIVTFEHRALQSAQRTRRAMQAIGPAAPAAGRRMNLRSWLFIPGDSEKKLGKADASGADVLILDLEDSVAAPAKAAARALVRSFLDARPGPRSSQLWVRINPLDSGPALDDLVAVVPGRPDGVMIPKANGPADVARLSHYLDALEAQHGVGAGAIRILPVASETAAAPFQLGDYAKAFLPRLAGLTWGAEDLATALGASTNLDETGRWALTFRMVRSLTLLGARAAGVQPSTPSTSTSATRKACGRRAKPRVRKGLRGASRSIRPRSR